MARRRTPKIERWWRVFLAVAGVVLIAIGLSWWNDPPSHTTFAPQATSAKEQAAVDEPSEVLSGLLIALGAGLLLVAANGRVLASLKLGDQFEATFGEAAADAAEAKTKKKGARRNLDERKVEEAVEIARKTAFAQATLEPLEKLDVDAIANDALDVVA